jgi:protein phosphatase 1L
MESRRVSASLLEFVYSSHLLPLHLHHLSFFCALRRLAVSRGIGDAPLKKYITPDPDICEYDIRPDDWFLVVASDGIWDVLENDQVASMCLSYSCNIINQNLVVNPENLKCAAQKICDRAKELGSRDNLSAIVVDLQNYASN